MVMKQWTSSLALQRYWSCHEVKCDYQWVLGFTSIVSRTYSICDFHGVEGVWYGGLQYLCSAHYLVLLASSGRDLQCTGLQTSVKGPDERPAFG